MVTRASARVHDNAGAALAALKDEAASCTRCPLHRHACRTVFGEGPVDAPLMFVGEQPGDQEDQAGRPFIGPAGQLFDRALGDAGIDRSAAYVTNAVKHFKFEARGKRRIHARPNAGEIMACRWWIDQERAIVKPRLTVALGATATHSLFGKAMPVGPLRGRATRLPGEAGELWTTVHPSYLLRLPDEQARSTEYARFVVDLAAIAAHLRRDRDAALT
jgi:DNA polymerase